jgi:hypothetical protein
MGRVRKGMKADMGSMTVLDPSKLTSQLKLLLVQLGKKRRFF